MTVWIVIAIAILILVVWLILQPKQGDIAANAPDTYHPIVISDDLRQQVQRLVAEGRTITAIKKLRQQGMGLHEAKQYLDTLPKLPAIDEFGKSSASLNQAEVDSKVRRLLSQNQKIKAIKFVRQQLGYGLREAKDYVESLGQ